MLKETGVASKSLVAVFELFRMLMYLDVSARLPDYGPLVIPSSI